MFDKYYKEKSAYMKVTKDVNLSRVASPKITQWKTNNPDIIKKLGEYETKYVVGEISLTEFKKFLDNEYFPSVADAEKEITELAKAKYGSK